MDTKKILNTLNAKKPVFMAVGACIGVVATAIFSASEAPKARVIFDELHKEDIKNGKKISMKTIFGTAKELKYTIASSSATIGLILGENYIYTKKLINLTNEMTEILNIGYSPIVSAGLVAMAEKSKNSPSADELEKIEVDEEGETYKWFYDSFTDIWFRSTTAKVFNARDLLWENWRTSGTASVVDYYENIKEFEAPSTVNDIPFESYGWDCEDMINEWEFCEFVPFNCYEIVKDGYAVTGIFWPIPPKSYSHP